MSELLTVEAVSTKFKNKYNSGSVLSGGTWLQVDKDVDIGVFQKDSQIEVETKVNDKGYKSIIGLVNSPKTEVKKTTKKATKAPELKEVDEAVAPKVSSYEDNKNQRILVQGIVQAAAQCPALAGLPFTTVDDIISNVIKLADGLLEAVEERIN